MIPLEICTAMGITTDATLYGPRKRFANFVMASEKSVPSVFELVFGSYNSLGWSVA